MRKMVNRYKMASQYPKCMLLLCAISVFALPASCSPTEKSSKVAVLKFDTQAGIIHTTDEEKFLSFAMDAIIVYNNFKKFDIGNPKLTKMMKLLSPAFWRIGGTSCGRIQFSVEGSASLNSTEPESDIHVMDDRPYKTLYGQDWIGVNKMAQEAGVNIIYDLNDLQRIGNAWDPTNSIELIEFSDANNFDLHFELGNELEYVKRTFDQDITTTELGKDFHNLKLLLQKYPRYANSMVIGPDIGHINKTFMDEFFAQAKNDVDAITFHHYYFDGKTASAADFTDPTILDKLIVEIQKGIDSIKGTEKKLWLGETASAYGSGSPLYSDRFIGMYCWLDKLGLSAKMGLDVIIRQDIVNGNYALVDPTYNPNPDWWLSILYKKLVGPQVLSCESNAGNKVRLYCHCTKNQPGSATVFGMNLENDGVEVSFDGIVPSGLAPQAINVQAYVLTSNNQPYEKIVRLNGVPLALVGDNDLPEFKPKQVVANPTIEIPSHGLGFWVLPSTACN